MCRTFIQRSAFHRMNSISSASRCALRVTAVVPSYSSTRVIDDRDPRSTKSRVIGVPGYGVGCWMYGQSTYCRANARFAAIDSRRVVGVADDQAADDEHAVAVQDVDRVERRVAVAPPVLVPAVLRARLQEREILVEDVLDAEEHVAESGLPHQRRQRRRRARRSAPSSPCTM